MIAPSERVYDTLRRYGVKTDIKISRTGVDLTQAAEQKDPHLREKLGLADVPVLVLLGCVAYEKRIDKLKSAMPAILAQSSKAGFLIVGDGPAREEE